MGQLTQYNYLKGELVIFNKQKEDLTQKVKSFCQNKEYPLDDRWNLFIESDLGEHQSWYLDLNSVDLYNYYSNRERHQKIESKYLIFWLDEHAYTNVNEIKEEILQLFIKSFEYDW